MSSPLASSASASSNADTSTDASPGFGDGRGTISNAMNNAPQVLTPWRQRLEASMSANRFRGSNYVQLASVDKDGEPACRTVVFRGFLGNIINREGDPKLRSPLMQMMTDLRSEKVSHFKKNDIVEMVWWFPHSSEQYRIKGHMRIVDETETNLSLKKARNELWVNKLSLPAKQQFLWDQGGIPYTGDIGDDSIRTVGSDGGVAKEHDDSSVKSVDDAQLARPHRNYALMVFQPTRVKYLRLTDNYAQLDIRPDASWVELDTFTAEENSWGSSIGTEAAAAAAVAEEEQEWLCVRINP